MIDVDSATRIIFENAVDFGQESLLLQNCYGRVLAEEIRADRDFPPFDRVSMDGIAIRFADFADGQREFPLQGVQAAGMPRKTVGDDKVALEVMTGAILPKGLDTIVRYEDVEKNDGSAVIGADISIKEGQHVHTKGNDRKSGDLLIGPGRRISIAELGVAATVGKTHLRVQRQPKLAVISTGDELVEVTQNPMPHQIRSSNTYAIAGMLQGRGLDVQRFHFPDDPAHLREGLGGCLNDFDVVLLSGGVSRGKYDHVPDALESLGVEKLFHRVAQKPGKPFWFGQRRQKCTVFALPGNPVSAVLCTLRYLLPWLQHSLGFLQQPQYLKLDADFRFDPPLTYFLQVRRSGAEEKMRAMPIVGKGSGDLANLVDADGFLELPADRSQFRAGEAFPFWSYR